MRSGQWTIAKRAALLVLSIGLPGHAQSGGEGPQSSESVQPTAPPSVVPPPSEAPGEPAPISVVPPPSPAGSCFPECRAGYVCSPQGQCVTACNPACPVGTTCSPQGTCVSACNPPCAVGATCTAEGACVASGPNSSAASSTSGTAPETPFYAHPLGGLSFSIGGKVGMGGTAYWVNYAEDGDGTGLFAFNAAAHFGAFEVSVEFAPVTHWVVFDGEPLLSFTGTVGGLLPLGPNLYWPLRFRFGITAVNADLPVLGFDLLGIGWRTESDMLFEIVVPSVRYVGDFEDINFASFPITFSVAKAF